MENKYSAYLRPTWWTVIDAANIICGFVPPAREWRKEGDKNIPPFDMELSTGGDRALLYFELKNLMVEQGQELGPNARIRPALALKVARSLGITPPADLASLEVESAEPRALSVKRETTLLRTIGALLAIIEGAPSMGVSRHPDIQGQDEMAELIDKRADIHGLGKRNLQGIFGQGNAEFRGAIK